MYRGKIDMEQEKELISVTNNLGLSVSFDRLGASIYSIHYNLFYL